MHTPHCQYRHLIHPHTLLQNQAKELVEGAPKVIKKDVKKEEVRGCHDLHTYTCYSGYSLGCAAFHL